MGFDGFGTGHLLFIVIVILPLVHVLLSDRSHGGAKFGWFLAVFLFSWMGYIVFLIVTQSNLDAKNTGSN